MQIRVKMLLLVICLGHLPVLAQNNVKDSKTNLILSSVRSYLGTAYQYGGTSRKGIDCSGLIYVCFNTGGIEVPRTAKDQAGFGKKVKINRLKPGDLVFFKFKQKGEKSWHSGVITVAEKDKIRFIHSSSSKGVIESDLLSDYYRENIKGFRRLI